MSRGAAEEANRRERLEAAAAAHVVRRARAVVRVAATGRPPFPPDRYAAAFTSGLDRRLPRHTPQWNGCLALAFARTFLPPGAAGPSVEALAEIGAAELLLPMRAFRPIAARTDLTMDGLRDLAVRFASPIRLTVRQWLRAGTWRGFALLWCEDGETLRLEWRAASPDARFPRTATIGARAESFWGSPARLYGTLRTGRPHHGVEEILTGGPSVWWFTRFGVVRDLLAKSPREGGRGVLALVALARGR